MYQTMLLAAVLMLALPSGLWAQEWVEETPARLWESSAEVWTDADRAEFQRLHEEMQRLLARRGAVEVRHRLLVTDGKEHEMREGSNLGMEFEIHNRLGAPIVNVKLWCAFSPAGLNPPKHDETFRAFPLPTLPAGNSPHSGWRVIRLDKVVSSDKVQISFEALNIYKTRKLDVYVWLTYDISGPSGGPVFCHLLTPPLLITAVTR